MILKTKMETLKCARVIINNSARATDKLFSYIAEDVCPGMWVKVPFGKGNTIVDGMVFDIAEEEENPKLKEIYSKGEILLSEKQLKLLSFMREKYLCTYYDALKILLPPGAMSKKNRGFDGAGNRKMQFAVFNPPLEDNLEEIISYLNRKAPAQARALDIVSQVEKIAIADLEDFAGISRQAVKALEKKGLLTICDFIVERDPFKNLEVEKTHFLKPTKEQKEAIDYINSSAKAKKFEEILLRGITGSGKTEVYLRAVDNVLKMGRKAIILVPEISLTPQMSLRFASRFKDRVAIIHSGLSMGERFDTWKKIKEGRVDVVVGARSAIFAPLENIGIIVIDEEHENSYKSDMTPKYDAREVASQLCRLNNGVLVLASATPSLKSGYRAVKGEIKLLQIKNRYNNANLPEAEIVDLRYEIMKGNKSFISGRLKEEIEKNLENKEQTIIFLNRRGYSTFVSCRSCGYVAKCPVCDVALTYHKYNESLMCHYCGYTMKNPKLCPECKSKYIKYFGVGTQRVVEEINILFPDATTLRMDVDTTREKMSHHKILEQFKNEKTDILVGTQMITKGLDFPDVTLVGVLAADMMLYVDDYSANERTFQLITQVVGRAGRGDKKGRAIIQTYSPQHQVIKTAKEQDYKTFFAKEIAYRQKTGYPPFCDIVHIVVSGEDIELVKENMADIYKEIKNSFENEGIYATLIGPSPSPVAKISNRYRWRVLIKCENNEKLRKILREKIVEVTRKDISVNIDINPTSII